MEEVELTRPAFWESGHAVAPGAEIDRAALEAPGTAGLVFFQTSGTTGDPAWIGLSRQALRRSAATVNTHLGVTADDCWGLALPVGHVGGFGVAARAFEGGCRLACWKCRWKAGEFTEWLMAEGVTHLSLVPTQVHDLVAARLPAPDCLRAVVVGGGSLDDDRGAAARRLGWPVLASYGMTEAGSQVATQRLDQLAHPYAASPIPVLPLWRVRADSDGRIEIAGEALFSGWLRKSEGAWVFEERPGEWHPTSDAGELNEGGLVIRGRLDSMVKVLGELVDPLAVEQAIGLDHVVVIAVPDPRMGHRLIAVSEPPLLESSLRSAVASHNRNAIGPRRIDEIFQVTEIPRGTLGKPRRRLLVRQFESI